MLEHEGKGHSLLAVVQNGHGGGSLHLLYFAVLVVLAVAEPLSKLDTLGNLEQRDVACLGECLHR